MAKPSAWAWPCAKLAHGHAHADGQSFNKNSKELLYINIKKIKNFLILILLKMLKIFKSLKVNKVWNYKQKQSLNTNLNKNKVKQTKFEIYFYSQLPVDFNFILIDKSKLKNINKELNIP